MGYWSTSLTGASLQQIGDLNPDGSEMLWGDAPADRLDDGIEKLILRLQADLGRSPTVGEVDAEKATAPEMIEAIAKARKVFAEDIEREATDGEIAAGLAFSDTGISLESVMRRDIVVGDTIRWAVMRDCGFFTEIDNTAEAVVESIEERDRINTWTGNAYTHVVYVVTVDGVATDVDRAYASKVLPGDRTVEEENTARDRRRKADEWLQTDYTPPTEDSQLQFPLLYNRNLDKD